MAIASSAAPTSGKPLRLWPGAIAVALQWTTWIVLTLFVPDSGGTALAAVAVTGLLVILWWLFFSRAPWIERLAAIGLMVVSVWLASSLVHPSIANGMMGMMPRILAIPLLCLALVAAAAAGRRLAPWPRRALMAVALPVACVPLLLVRTEGLTGSANSDFHWRWTPTHEERLLALGEETPLVAVPLSTSVAPEPSPPASSPAATPGEEASPPAEQTDAAAASPASVPSPVAAPQAPPDATATDEPSPPAPAAALAAAADWPGFRGASRDSVVRGLRIDTDWASSPPIELWRRPIGPGWSSFAVRGNLVYTQEQRGGDEVVSCYLLTSGDLVWRHRDPVRFWESNAGAGPRATPTLSGGCVYTLGATGLLNALDARTGAVVWARNAATDVGQEVPGWGFAGSPLVLDDLVIVALSGQLAAYDARSGARRWIGPPEGGGYSSPHLVTIGGVPQVVLARGRRTTSVAPADGRVLWEHTGDRDVSILQPAQLGDGAILVAAGDGMGDNSIRRIELTNGDGRWTVTERWASRGLKPYFNDFVVHEGHAYGFDGSILSCIELEGGTRKWKGGRYGYGQTLLLADQDVLLLVSEQGELALVPAVPDGYSELARFKAVDGKTWNHPVIVGDVLLVRNGTEMAAFRLRMADAKPDTQE